MWKRFIKLQENVQVIFFVMWRGMLMSLDVFMKGSKGSIYFGLAHFLDIKRSLSMGSLAKERVPRQVLIDSPSSFAIRILSK